MHMMLILKERSKKSFIFRIFYTFENIILMKIWTGNRFSTTGVWPKKEINTELSLFFYVQYYLFVGLFSFLQSLSSSIFTSTNLSLNHQPKGIEILIVLSFVVFY